MLSCGHRVLVYCTSRQCGILFVSLNLVGSGWVLLSRLGKVLGQQNYSTVAETLWTSAVHSSKEGSGSEGGKRGCRRRYCSWSVLLVGHDDSEQDTRWKVGSFAKIVLFYGAVLGAVFCAAIGTKIGHDSSASRRFPRYERKSFWCT